MQVDFKNYNKPGNFPPGFEITGEMESGSFPITLRRGNFLFDDDDEPLDYIKQFDYRFDFAYRNKISGTAYVYRGGFYIRYKRPFGIIYNSPHCNHFSMPMCQHFTEKGAFTQFFIDRLMKEVQYQLERQCTDEAGAFMRYANQRKGR